MRCSWCNSKAPLRYRSPDYRVRFCSAWCQTKYYNSKGIPHKHTPLKFFLLIVAILVTFLLFAALYLFI